MDQLLLLKNLFDRAIHASTPEEEARTAALMAVRLMHKLGLSPSNTSGVIGEPTRANGGARGARPAEGGIDWSRFTPEERAAWEHGQHTAGKRKPRKPTVARNVNGQVYVKEPVRLRSHYPGICVGCGETYDKNDVIFWVKNEGATHAECRGFWNYNGVR